MVNPEMVRLAREARGLTQNQLAIKLDISQGKISKLEDGLLTNMPDSFIDHLSKELNFPPSFFKQVGSSRAACASFYRKKSALPMRILNQCDALMNIVRLQIEKLLQASDIEKKELPHLDPDEFDGGPEEIAQRIRTLWKLPRGAIKDVTQVVEDAGCIVVRFDFGTKKLDGLSIWTESGVPVIFLNPTFPSARTRFTLAHELGHIVMHRIPTPDMEEQAMRFAGEFLMPENEIKSQFYPTTIDRLARLKLAWKVSMQALLMRAEQVGVLSERYSRYLWMQMGKFGYRTKEPHDEQIQSEYPTLFNELIQLHLNELEYSTDELAESLGMWPSDLAKEFLPPEAQLRVV